MTSCCFVARSAKQKMEAAGSLVVAMVAHGVDHNREWPFIALSSFQQRSSTVRGLSGALFLGFLPKVRSWLIVLIPWLTYDVLCSRHVKLQPKATRCNSQPQISVLLDSSPKTQGNPQKSRSLGKLHSTRRRQLLVRRRPRLSKRSRH